LAEVVKLIARRVTEHTLPLLAGTNTSLASAFAAQVALAQGGLRGLAMGRGGLGVSDGGWEGRARAVVSGGGGGGDDDGADESDIGDVVKVMW
jgi:hypothetical protein